jgi:hypothetical protein
MDVQELFRVSSEAFILKIIEDGILTHSSWSRDVLLPKLALIVVNRNLWAVLERFATLLVDLNPFRRSAIVGNKVEALEVLYPHCEKLRSPADMNYQSTLLLAAEHGSTRVLHWLLDHGHRCPATHRANLLYRAASTNHADVFTALLDAMTAGDFGPRLVGVERARILAMCAGCAGQGGCPEVFALCTAEPGVSKHIRPSMDMMLARLVLTPPFEPGRAAAVLATADAIQSWTGARLHQERPAAPEQPAAAVTAVAGGAAAEGTVAQVTAAVHALPAAPAPALLAVPAPPAAPAVEFVVRACWVSHLAGAVRSSNAALVRWTLDFFRARTSARLTAQLAAAGVAAVAFYVPQHRQPQCTPYPAGSVGAQAAAEIADLLIEAVAGAPGLTFSGLTGPGTDNEEATNVSDAETASGEEYGRAQMAVGEFCARFVAALRDYGGQSSVADMDTGRGLVVGLSPPLHRLALLLTLRPDSTLAAPQYLHCRMIALCEAVARAVPFAPAAAPAQVEEDWVVFEAAAVDQQPAARASHVAASQQAPGGVTLALAPLPALVAMFPARAAPPGPEEPCPVCFCVGAEVASCSPYCVHLRRCEDIEDARICQWLLSDPAARAHIVASIPLMQLARSPSLYRKPNTLAVLLSAGFGPASLSDAMLEYMSGKFLARVVPHSLRDVAVFSVMRAFRPSSNSAADTLTAPGALGRALLRHASHGSLLLHVARYCQADFARFFFADPATAGVAWLTSGPAGCPSALCSLSAWGWASTRGLPSAPASRRAGEYTTMLLAQARAELAGWKDGAEARVRLWSLLNEAVPPPDEHSGSEFPEGSALSLVASAARIACQVADTWPALEVLLRAGGSPVFTSLCGGGTVLHELLAPLAPVRTTDGSVGAPIRAVLQAVKDAAPLCAELDADAAAAKKGAPNQSCTIV